MPKIIGTKPLLQLLDKDESGPIIEEIAEEMDVSSDEAEEMEGGQEHDAAMTGVINYPTNVENVSAVRRRRRLGKRYRVLRNFWASGALHCLVLARLTATAVYNTSSPRKALIA